MNLRDLEYLVALSETLHFGRAAQRCHVSQPTLSTQLRKLEDTLGAALIERQPRQVVLTPLGEAVVARARQVLQGARDIRDLAATRQDPLAGRLRIGLIPTLGPYLLPRIAARLQRRLPRLQLVLHEYQTMPLIGQLHAGGLDLGLLALPADTGTLATRSLFAEAFVVAMPKSHALARAKRIRPRQLAGQDLLLLEEGHCLRDQALEVCGSDANTEQDVRATSLETLRQMVAAGLGITLLPRLAAEGPIGTAPGMVTRPFTPPAPSRVVGAAWRKSSTRLPAITAVLDLIEKALG